MDKAHRQQGFDTTVALFAKPLMKKLEEFSFLTKVGSSTP